MLLLGSPRSPGNRAAEAQKTAVRLYGAVKGNEQLAVRVALDHGADVNFLSKEEPSKALKTPLRTACAQANVPMIRMLLVGGARVFAHLEVDRWSAFHSAAETGQDEIMRMLLVEAEELHAAALHDGFSLMHLLVECLNPNLLSGGADLVAWALKSMNTLEFEVPSRRAGYADWTPLHLACARGCVKAAELLVRRGASINCRTGEFHLGSPKVNELAKGPACGPQVASIEVGFSDIGPQWLDDSLLPIHLAAFGGHLRAVLFLFKRGQPINATTRRHQWTPLMFAVWSGNGQLVREICRLGGREVVNSGDRRGDGSVWTPLALAVARSTPEVINVLVEYGADPLARVPAMDFPGRAFLRGLDPSNQWTGPDRRISLLHIAVVRGNLAVLQTVLPLMRAAHFSPVRGGATTARQMQSEAGHRASATDDLVRSLADTYAPRQRARLKTVPVTEGLDWDPVTFCTAEGWSPAGLAILLHAADPANAVRGVELAQAFPDMTGCKNSRADVFLELLHTRVALLEDKPDAEPPVLHQRLPDVGEALACQAASEFLRLCRGARMEVAAQRVLANTLCVACRFDRMKLVRHLLESGVCDACCDFLQPVAAKPIHIAASSGCGFLVHLLMEHRADALEKDERAEVPMFKLARAYAQQIADLQDRVAELESQLDDGTRSSRQGR